ncbi:MAG TPA: LysR family transcriptional regulator [Steroidobacteraceae bacterium]|nr:LysR family transcriptional regulator [Steroidobacteraceae bacterium]
MDRLLWMTCFARAVETGSFTAVGRELGIGQPNVSRHVAALEDYLGIRLLQRSTRRLHLTPEGERYYVEARRVLDAVSEAEAGLRGHDQPVGLLRVACPTSLGRAHVLPLVGPLLARFPALELDLQIGDQLIDLAAANVDLALCIGEPRDRTLRSRRIGSAEYACVATPACLARDGTPSAPDALIHHACILDTLQPGFDHWLFREGEFPVRGRLRVNAPDGVHSAVLEDLGIGYAPLWVFEDDILAGRVRLLLVDHSPPAVPIHLVHPPHPLLPRRTQVFADFVAAQFRQIPALNEGGLARLASAGFAL